MTKLPKLPGRSPPKIIPAPAPTSPKATRLSGGAVVVIMIGAIYLAHMDWFEDLRKLFTSEQIFLFIIGLYFTIRAVSYTHLTLPTSG